MRIQDTKVGDAHDDEMRSFLTEIGNSCGFSSEHYAESTVRQFIELCRSGESHYGKPRTARTIKPSWPEGVLASRVSKLKGSVLTLIEELCWPLGLSVELLYNTPVSAAINKLTPQKKQRRH